MDNSDRAEVALVGLQAFADEMYGDDYERNLMIQESFEQAASDFLADLMHAADRASSEVPGSVAHRILHRAHDHYEAELAEENADPPPLRVVREDGS